MFLMIAKEGNRFKIFSDTLTGKYVGCIIQSAQTRSWVCHPEIRLQDMDKPLMLEIDKTLRLLNSPN